MIDYLKTYKEKPQYVLSKDSENSTQGFSTENSRKFIESAILLNCFEKNNTVLIFIDEFSFQTRKLVYKRWVKRSSKPFTKRSNESRRYGFIVGL